MRKKKKHEEQEDEQQADMAAIEEAESELADEGQVADTLDQVAASADGEVKKAELTGEAKKKRFEQPGTNNQSRVDIGTEEKQK